MEEEGSYQRFYLLRNGDTHIRQIPGTGRRMTLDEFKEMHRKLDPATKFCKPPLELEAEKLEYNELFSIYNNSKKQKNKDHLCTNEPPGGFSEPASPHPDLSLPGGFWQPVQPVRQLHSLNPGGRKILSTKLAGAGDKQMETQITM